MPRTGRRFPDGVAIEVEDLQATYLPGDIIIGRLVCSKPPAKDASRPYQVRMNLYGRAKTKYVVKTTEGTSINRGRASLFDRKIPLTESAAAGVGERVWSFAATLPVTSQEGLAQRGDEFRHHGGYLSTRTLDKTSIDVTKHPLPAVMYHHAKSDMSGKTSEAYVEYFLQANIAGLQATLPLFIRTPGTSVPIQDFEPKAMTLVQMIRTPRLLSEHAGTELSFRQKSSRFFMPSKTPRYSFSVKVEYPTVIQLEHPSPLPLKVAIIPDLNPKNTSICPDGNLQSLPPVNLTSIKLEIKIQLDIRCPGSFYDHENDKVHTVNIPFRRMFRPVPLPAISTTEIKHVMPAPDPHDLYNERLRAVQLKQQAQGDGSDAGKRTLSTSGSHEPLQDLIDPAPPYSTTTPTQPLHLGERFSIFIGSSACSTLGNPPVSFKRQLFPTFKTYNIRMSYQLRWKIGIECAGETAAVSGERPLTILGPSEEQEALRKRELGVEGMQKNYDDLEAGIEQGLQLIGGVLSAVGG